MGTTKLRHRAFALVFALLFAFTAVATSVAVILSIISSNKAAKKASTQTTSQTSKTHKCTTTCLAGKPLSGFTPVNNVPSLKVSDIKVGNGPAATLKSTIGVYYAGAIASTGIVFQSSLDTSTQPVVFPLNQVILGWQQGIPGMKVGGTRQLLIPAALAYGSTGQQGIPANSDLVFDVTLLSVK